MVNAGHVVGTRVPGIVFSAADVLWMSLLHGMRGVCDMCMCLARGGTGGEWRVVVDERIGFVFTNPVGVGGVLDVCLRLSCGGVGGAHYMFL